MSVTRVDDVARRVASHAFINLNLALLFQQLLPVFIQFSLDGHPLCVVGQSIENVVLFTLQALNQFINLGLQDGNLLSCKGCLQLQVCVVKND